MSARLGFIGVGLMGGGMAANLLKAGHDVRVVAHRNRAPIDALIAQGAAEARSRAALAQECDGLFVCLNGSPQVEAVIDEIEAALPSGAYVIDASTSNPVSTVGLHARLAARGVRLVDAPITGGPAQAADGALNSLIGGDAAAVDHVAPWIGAYSRTALHVGGPGAGHRAKLLNNMVTLGAVALVTQAYRVARDEGLDWAKLFDAMMGGAARSGTLEKMVRPALDGDFTGHKFSVANGLKDIGYAEAYLSEIGAPSDIVAAVRAFLADEHTQLGGDAFLSMLLAPNAAEQPEGP